MPMDPRIRDRRIQVRRDEGRKRLRLLIAFGSCLIAAGAVVAALHSALLDVDHVRVAGAVETPAAQITAAAGLDHHRFLVDIDPSAVRARVGALPWVADVEVRRRWPGTVRIRVTERKALASLPAPGNRTALVDATGRVLALTDSAPAGTVRLEGLAVAPAPGEELDGPGRAALVVAAALPATVRPRVAIIRAVADGFELHLAGSASSSPVVEFGSTISWTPRSSPSPPC